ncbi:MAG: hypothetical protein KAV87_52595 [Desulfobacteraceae bacterium]|nr:hypothetical protein [Desulfobacteraceae bacterium]
MGTILILRPDNFSAEEIRISESHINVWLLPALGGAYHILDIGFYLENSHRERNINEIQAIVPLRNPETSCLITQMENQSPQSWRVIFRGKEPLDRTVLSTFEPMDDPQSVPKSYSRWKVKFDPPINPGEEKYIRIRFSSYYRPAYLDFYGGWLGFGRRIRVDLRLFDHREHAEFLNMPEHLEGKLIPIQRSNVYLVASQARHPELFSPEFAYIRVLESQLWLDYLGRKPNLIRPHKRKMHIFAWKREKEESALSIDSHRIFVSFKTSSVLLIGTRILHLISWLIIAILLAVLAGKNLLRVWSPSAPTQVPTWLNQIFNFWPLAVVVLILLELNRYGSIIKGFAKIIRLIDGWIYGTKH